MQERGNKFKPLSKKEVQQSINFNQETALTQNSKLSSNSQNKIFIRKPVSKRHGFVSPSFAKNRVPENEEVKSPCDQLKNSHSDADYWENKDRLPFNHKISLKRYISDQQNLTHQPNHHFNNVNAINEAYFGNQTHALTQIGQHYKVQTIESDNSQKDLFFGQNMKKNSKQNIVNSLNLNTKKVTRTEYFTNHNVEEVRSTTSRSLKQKQLNFKKLRNSVNNNIEVYVLSLEENIRKLQKTNYTLTKKCKWMHEEVEMHLEKEHLMIAEKKGFEVQLKAKQSEIKKLNEEKLQQIKQLDHLRYLNQRQSTPLRNKSLKDLQTISSLKQFCTKIQEKDLTRQNKIQQSLNGYFGNSPSSIQKNKKLSFKTYPGVCSPKKRKQDGSKCSSIVGQNESYQDLGESSILYEKSIIRNQEALRKSTVSCEELRKQRDGLKNCIENLKEEMNSFKQNQVENENRKSQQHESTIRILQDQISALKQTIEQLKGQKEILATQIDKIVLDYQTEIQALTAKIKQLEGQIALTFKPISSSTDLKDFEGQNPLKYFLQHSQNGANYSQQSEMDHLQHQNKSLRTYIQKILEHYKYTKIENRMLLKVKEEKEKLEKEKKQIKDERDSFKKKLLDLIKNKSGSNKQIKSNKRLMDFGSDSSEEESSAVFELSQSEIKYSDSEINPN